MKLPMLTKIGSPAKLRATAIEYGLIAACISIVIIVAMNAVGPKLNNTLNVLVR